MNDIDIVEKAKNGDTAAFKKLFDRYKTFVWNVSYRMTYDFDEAEDVTQEVFIKVWKNLSGFKGASRFSTWVYRITVNSALNRLSRAGNKNRPLDENVLKPEDAQNFMKQNPEAALSELEAERELATILSKLDDDRRMTIILREIEGLSYEEIAMATGAPIGTVRSRISRGRKELEEMAALMEKK